MTLQEVKDWIKGTPVEAYEEDSYDDSGNHYQCRIYRKNGQYFRLEFCNDHPYNLYVEGKGYVRDQYHGPVEVFKKSRVITETYYETDEESKLHAENLRLSRPLLESEGILKADTSVGRHGRDSQGD